MASIFSSLNIILSTTVVLLTLTGLAILGIKESSIAAVVIFITHLVSLTLLVFSCCWFIFASGFDVFNVNWNYPITSGSITKALFLGFAAALLGISGFESSANFVEEQQEGVFPKTLRNMWAMVSFFNPVLALLIIFILSLATVGGHRESLLAYLGEITGGRFLGISISVDAVLVLCGAVLTSFVGVSGLLERMTLDRILPNYFLKQNKRGSNYRIVIAFLILCLSVFYATNGNLTALAGVYTFSFLAVMVLFGIGNLLLKYKRKKLPRPVKANSLVVIIAILLVASAFIGNMRINIDSFYTFIYYLIPASAFILNNAKQRIYYQDINRDFRAFLLVYA